MKKIIIALVLSMSFSYMDAQAWTWIKQFSSTGDVTPVDIVYGNDHNVYITGLYTQALTIGTTTLPYSGPDPRVDIFLCSFTSDGTFRWARQIGGNHIDDVGGIAVDNNNNIYIAGGYRSTTLSFPPSSTTLSNINQYDAFLAKYDNNGNLIFAGRTFWGTDVQRIKDVVVDFTNNRLALVGFFKTQLIYFDGSIDQTIPTTYLKEHFIALYDLDGNFINIKTIPGSQESSVFKTVNNCVYGGNVQGYFITGDLIGKLYLPGNDTLKGDEVYMDAMVVRYDATLNYLWSRRGGGTGYEHVNSAARDDNGNIYLAGKCQADPIRFDSTKTLLSAPLKTLGGIDYYLAKYNRNGYLQWIRRKGGTGDDNAYGLSVKNSRVVTAGNIADGSNVNTGFDLYNVNGSFIAGDSITGDNEDQGQGVVFNSDADSIFLTGYFKSIVLNAGPLSLTNTVAGLQDGFFVKYGYKFKIFLDKKTNITCNGSNNGYIKVGTQFGVNPVTYNWVPNVSSTYEASGLVAGNYKIIATDNTSNKDSIIVSITQPAALTITTDLLKNVTCYGGEDGEINVTITGGTSPYTLTWSGPDNLIQNSTTQTGLIFGSYKLDVLDASRCTVEKVFNINQPPKIIFSGSSVNGIIIPPSCNGAVNLTVSGGTPAYTYNWSGPSGYSSTNSSISGLCLSGDYNLTVTDSKLCTQDTIFNVPVDSSLNITICAKTNISCKGEVDGYAKVCVTQGGTGNYNYAWRTSGGSPVGGNDDELIDVAKGTYYVKVTDNGNGKWRETSVKIDEPAIALTPYFNEVRKVSCYGRCDGYIDLEIIGGWSPYKYQWSPSGDTTQDVSNLCPGPKFVTVTDANNCVILLDTIITQPTEIAVTSVTVYDSITCNGDSDGALWAHATGGTKPYTYFWDDDGYQNDSIATDLYSDQYAVYAIDAMGCKSLTATKFLYGPELIDPHESKSDVKCKGGSDGSITLNPSGGTPPYTYLWDDGPVTKERSGLPAGQYCVTVTDYHGCTSVHMCIDINEPATSVSINSITIDSVSCFGGSNGIITFNATGGTGIITYTITPGGTSNTTGIFDNLPTGDYCVNVMDNNSCSLDTCHLIISQPDAIMIYGRTDSVSSYEGTDGSIIIDSITGGTPPYNCSWADGSNDCDRIELQADTFIIIVTDSHGCTQDSSFIVGGPNRINKLFTESGISLYPNPTTGRLTVEIEAKDHKDINLEIVNLLGQVIWKKELQYNGQPRFVEVIDMSQQSKGTYFMRVNGLAVHTKILVE